jgi:hypothetical protein
MSDEFKDNDQIKAGSKHHDQHAIDRRNLLLGTSTLVAAATLTSPALAQAQKAAPAAAPAPAAASGSKPNILVIMGDDVGWFNVGAYHQGIMSGKRRTSTSSPPGACALPTTTPKQAAPQAAPISSPGNFPCAAGSPPLARLVRMSACRISA